MPNNSHLIQQQIRTFLAEVLFFEPDEIDDETSFPDLGLDSVIGVEFLQTVNSEYGLEEDLDVLFEHPSPSVFTEHIIQRIRAKEAVS